MSAGNFQNAVRWVPVYNPTDYVIPPFAVMRITGVTLRERQIIYQVGKPNSESESLQRTEKHLFNGSTAIAKKGYGSGTMDFPGMALIESVDDVDQATLDFLGTIQVESVGYESGSWTLHYGQEAYILIDTIEDQDSFYSIEGSARAWVVPNARPIVVSAFVNYLQTAFAVSNSTLKSIPLTLSSASDMFPLSTNGYGIQVPMTGLYDCQMYGGFSINEEAPLETRPNVRLGLVVSDDAPVATAWQLEADWAMVLAFAAWGSWGWWHGWSGWTDWGTWAGWSGDGYWDHGVLHNQAPLRLTRGQYVGLAIVADAAIADADFSGYFSLTRIGG